MSHGVEYRTTNETIADVGSRAENGKGRRISGHSTFQRASELLPKQMGSVLCDSKGLHQDNVDEASKSIWEIIGDYERNAAIKIYEAEHKQLAEKEGEIEVITEDA